MDMRVGLENSMDCIVHQVAKSGTGLNDFHFLSLLLYKIVFVFKGVLVLIITKT